MKKGKNSVTHNTFLLLHYSTATCFGPSGPSSGSIGTMSEAKLLLHVKPEDGPDRPKHVALEYCNKRKVLCVTEFLPLYSLTSK
jgi:hypothetical protein